MKTPAAAPAVQNPAAFQKPASPTACLLCGDRQIERIDSFPAEDIRRVWKLFGVNFSPATWRIFDGLTEAELFRCRSCGFQFCDPKLAGDGEFYAELERQRKTYYAPDVPEFRRSLQWARERGLRTVLDIGCGEGAFLDRVRQAGLEGVGIELNLQAAEVCRKKGHTVYTQPLAELLEAKDGRRYDLVTVFQVLEHVPNPVQFLSQAGRFMAPHGCLSVAVPNESGIYRICPKEPHQWPPHHVTRWREVDLKQAGARCGFQVLASGANRLLGQEAHHFWRLRNQLAEALGARPWLGGEALPRMLALAYRALGCQYWVRGMGTSVYALYGQSNHEHS